MNGLDDLEYLNLGVNEIDDIQGLYSLKSLKTLRLHDNNITRVVGLDALGNLERLDLRYNRIEWIEGFDALKNAKKISLDGNPLQSDQERRLVAIGIEIGDVGMRLREREIAHDLVEYSQGKRKEPLLEHVAEELRRSVIKGLNSRT
jgi:Leucine-rich repeat (LRR) protein